jgi:hypothetical protein
MNTQTSSTMALAMAAEQNPIDEGLPGEVAHDGFPQSAPTQTTVNHVFVSAVVRNMSAEQFGVYAAEPIAAGTLCVAFGGFVMPGPDFRQLPADRQHHSLQIDEDVFLACGEQLDMGDLVNHSCDPTLVFVSDISLVARRDIAAGEELTFDYATCDSAPYDEFECECGTSQCRDKVTGQDWMNPDVQERYDGSFSPYLQRRIDALRD